MNTLLHERHLLEAVRQGVISQSQAEALLNLARTEAGGAGRLADTSWLGLAQAAVAAVVVGGVCVATVDHPWRTPAGLELAQSLGAAALFLGAGLALRRWRVAEAPAAVLLGGAVLQLLGVGHGVARLFQPFAYPSQNVEWGFIPVFVAGLAMWRALRVGPALAAVGMAVVAFSMEAARGLLGFHGHQREIVAFGLAGVTLTAASLWMDRAKNRSPVDGGFWLSLGGALCLALSGAETVDREPVMAVPALLVALLVGHLALQRRRRVLLGLVGMALFALPPFAAAEARWGDTAVAVAALLSAVGVSVGAHFARKALFAAGDDADDRSVWC
ncbi:MAG: hypothetical protein U0325_04230 [Polyangiales bacterium]